MFVGDIFTSKLIQVLTEGKSYILRYCVGESPVPRLK